MSLQKTYIQKSWNVVNKPYHDGPISHDNGHTPEGFRRDCRSSFCAPSTISGLHCCGYNGDWKKDDGGYQAHLDPIWRLERAQQTTIFRLRTGHCGLSAHLKRIGISDTSLCECGQADQTKAQTTSFSPAQNMPRDVS